MKLSFNIKCFCFLFACLIISCKQPQQQNHINTIKPIALYDFVAISYQLKSTKGKLIETTDGFDARPRLMFVLQPYFNGDLHSALIKLKEGDSASVKVSIDSLTKYMNYHHDPSDKSAFLIYNLKVNKVVKRDGLSDSLFNQAIEKLKAEEVEVARKSENKKINLFIKKSNKDYLKTNNGIYYTYLKQGKGQVAKAGESIKLNYKFSLLNGEVFETNVSLSRQNNHLFSLKIPAQSNVGFVQMASLLKPNDKISAVVPSALAYGKLGSKLVPPYAPIIMEIERLY